MPTTSQQPLRAALYARSNRPEPADHLDRQIDACRKIAEQNGWIADEYHDVQRSEKQPRTGFLQMLYEVKAGRIDVVVAYDLTRLSRRVGVVEDLIDTGVQVRLVEGPQLESPADRLQARILTAAAQYDDATAAARRSHESG